MFLFDLLCPIPHTVGKVDGLAKSVTASVASHKARLIKHGTQRPHRARNRLAYLFFPTFGSTG